MSHDPSGFRPAKPVVAPVPQVAPHKPYSAGFIGGVALALLILALLFAGTVLLAGQLYG